TAARRLLRLQAERQPDVAIAGFTVRGFVEADHRHELRIGITLDSTFGPMILFGQGGDVSRLYRDQAVGLPPLNLNLARRLIDETRVCRLLQGYGERPARNSTRSPRRWSSCRRSPPRSPRLSR
ncbi:MAG: hypothetical protein HC828_18945, partial [Blastochloris sp.]|nr:hypothetical protein [Blastochloris sp.]